MNKYIPILSLCCILFLSTPCFSEPLEKSDLDRIQVLTHQEHLLYETYLDTGEGIASVFGYHFDTQLTTDVHFVLAIFGAVSGQRGGYGIAAFGLAHKFTLTDAIIWDSRILMGSGGGGGLPAGGGLMIEAHAGPTLKVLDNLFLEAKYGYLKFPTGTFETPVFHIGLSFKTKGFILPY